MPELVNCAILTILLPAQETRGGVQRFIAPRLKREFVLPLPVCIPSCHSVSTFPHLSGDVLIVYAASANTDAQFHHGSRPLLQSGTLYPAPGIDRQGHVAKAVSQRPSSACVS